MQLFLSTRSGLVTLVCKQCHGVEDGGCRLLLTDLHALRHASAQTELGGRLGVRRVGLQVATNDLADHGQSHRVVVKASRHRRRRVVDNRSDSILHLLVEVSWRRAVGLVAEESVAAEDGRAGLVLLTAATTVQRAFLGLLLETCRVGSRTFKEVFDNDAFCHVFDEVEAFVMFVSAVISSGSLFNRDRFLACLDGNVLSAHEVEVSRSGHGEVSVTGALLVHRLGAHLVR